MGNPIAAIVCVMEKVAPNRSSSRSNKVKYQMARLRWVRDGGSAAELKLSISER